jgi:hypothetical protein
MGFGSVANDGNGDMYQYDISSNETTSEAVIQAIIDVSNETDESHRSDSESCSDGLEPLYYSIDCEALDEVFRPTKNGSSRSDGVVTFGYSQYMVKVEIDESVTIRPSRSGSNL